MKNIRNGVVLASAGVFAFAYIHKVTRKVQEQAQSKGLHVPYGPYEAFFKRPLDMLLSGIGLVVLSPVLGITALLVWVKLGKPVLYKQQRPGVDEKIFTLYKFRTMTDEKDRNGNLLADKKRLTEFGKWLRSTSLDELPELWNILKGDMSIVGPRPLLVEYLPRYSKKQKHRHDVKPGLTGLAQVSGRNRISWEEKFEDDIEYVNRITFSGDIKISLKTLFIVLKKSDINSDTFATMQAFIGSEE